MEIGRSRHVDASEPDAVGFYEYYYEYDIHSFRRDGRCYLARAYVDTPGEIAFLSCEEAGRRRLLDSADLADPLFREAVACLRASGWETITWLTERGYVPL